MVEKGYPKYYAPGDVPTGEKSPVEQGRIYISKTAPKSGKQGQYFEGVPPEVWQFRIGGYQPLRQVAQRPQGPHSLSFDDLKPLQAHRCRAI